MAEMNTQRGKKPTPRVDMTPMVDLGFLLITFFMLSTTLMQPKTMDLIMPHDADDGRESSIGESVAMTVLLGGHDKIMYYEGMLESPERPEGLQTTTYSGIRDAIIKKKNEILKATGRNNLMVLIKADNAANYRNVVDIMDEMLINRVDRYAMVDITDVEKEFLK